MIVSSWTRRTDSAAPWERLKTAHHSPRIRAPRLPLSRSLLEGWAQTIFDKTATDKLPKITEPKRAALKAALTTYKNSQTDQTGATGEATGTRIDRNSLVEQATERRMWIQFAADAEWPHTDPANTPIRREFQLPATRAFIG